MEKLTSVISNGQEAVSAVGNPKNGEKAETRVENSMRFIDHACQASMPRKRPHIRREPTYWWHAEIADIRQKWPTSGKRNVNLRRRRCSIRLLSKAKTANGKTFVKRSTKTHGVQVTVL